MGHRRPWGTLLACGALLAACTERVAPPDAKHIVVLIADDLGWAELGSRTPHLRTPRLDAFFEESLVLDRFYAFPLCTPTRAALLTARSPIRYGLMFAPLRPWESGGLPAEEHTLAEALREWGYETALVGKWHLGHTRLAHAPRAQGFEHFHGCLNGSVGYHDRSREGSLDWQRDGKSLEEEGYATDLIAAAAVRRIRERRTADPLFLQVAFTAPHRPLEAPQRLLTHFRDVENVQHRYFAAMIESLDAGVGRVLDALEEEGIAEDTVVLFCSDNGAPGETGGTSRAFPRNRPLMGGKWYSSEGGVRTLAAIRAPGALRAGASEAVVSALDVAPTLAALAGVEPAWPHPLDGADRTPALRGEEVAPRAPLLFGAQFEDTIRIGILDGEWKLLQDRRDGRVVRNGLFRPFDDPTESENLADVHPDEVTRLAALVEERLAREPADALRYTAAPPPEWRAPPRWAEAVR